MRTHTFLRVYADVHNSGADQHMQARQRWASQATTDRMPGLQSTLTTSSPPSSGRITPRLWQWCIAMRLPASIDRCCSTWTTQVSCYGSTPSICTVLVFVLLLPFALCFLSHKLIYSRLTPRTKGYNDTDDPWIVEQCPGSFVKQGIVSHGYQLNTELDLYQQWQNEGFQNVFSRGELALEPNPAEGEEAALLTAPAAVRLHPTALCLHSHLHTTPRTPQRKNNWYAVLDAGAGADTRAHFTALLRQVRVVDALAVLVAASQRGVGLDVWSWCVELILWIFRQQLILAYVRIFQPACTIPTKRGGYSCRSVCIVPRFARYR